MSLVTILPSLSHYEQSAHLWLNPWGRWPRCSLEQSGTGLTALKAFLIDVTRTIGSLRGGIFRLRNRMYLATWGYRHLLDPLYVLPPMVENLVWGALHIQVELLPFILPYHEVAYNGGAMHEPAWPNCLAERELGDWVRLFLDCLHVFHTDWIERE